MACIVHEVNGVVTSVVGDDGSNWDFTVQDDTPGAAPAVETPAVTETPAVPAEETPAEEVAEEKTETPAV